MWKSLRPSMCPRRHTSSLMSMACDAIPIVVRATTLTRVPPSTARIAQHNARATGHPVFIVGCWPATTTADGVHSIGLMSHPACGEAHREARYRNRHARARLARFQPTWASVDALTHAALTGESTNSNNNNHGVGMRRMPAGRRSPQEFPPAILPNCSSASTNNNRGCIALVVDPDVLLFKHTIKRACEYYKAYQYDAVLLFAPPRGRFTSLQEALDESKKALGASSSSSSSSSAAGSVDPAAAAYLESNAPLLDLMGNRHVSFLSVHALSALSTLTTEIAPTYDLDKGMDNRAHTHCSSAPQCHSLTAALPTLSLSLCAAYRNGYAATESTTVERPIYTVAAGWLQRLPRNNRQCELFHQTVGSSPTLQLLPAWTLLADDDSYVNTLPHLLLHCTASDAECVHVCCCC